MTLRGLFFARMILMHPTRLICSKTLLFAMMQCACPASAQADFSPFQTRDQNPFNLIHGQPLPVNASIATPGELHWNNTLTVTNTLNSQQLADESIYLDYESYRFNLGLQYGFAQDWSVKLDLPLVYKGAGMLDSAINNWHKLLTLPQANRPNVENNQYRIQHDRNGRTLTELAASDAGIGDLQLGLGHMLYTTSQSRLSLWTGLKLPTGSTSMLNSNGAVDASFWLAANYRVGKHWSVNSNAGLVLPALVVTGKRSPYNDALASQALFGHIMLAWQAVDWLDVKIQLEGHTSYYDDSKLRLLGSTYVTTFGGAIHINQCNTLDIAISEDVKVEASPDVSFLFGWRYRSGCQINSG